MRYRPWISAALVFAGCGLQDDLEEGRLALERKLNQPDRISYRWVALNECYPQMDRARFTWGRYRALLALLADPRYVVVPLDEFDAAKARHPDKVVVGLRHDIDGNFCKAAPMAALERAAGVRSTYYARHTDAYYAYGWPRPQRRRAIREKLAGIQAMGHEVGLHFDVLTLALRYGLDLGATLQAELDWLRAGGLRVTGVSHHGSDLAARLDFSNYEVFAGMTTRDTISYRGRTIALGTLDLADFGLGYEAYHLAYDHYFSDVGGRWSDADPVEALPGVKAGEGVVILTHPVWWGSDDDAFAYVE